MENYIHWNLDAIPKGEYFVTKILDDGTLTILLESDTAAVKVIFEGAVLSFRTSVEALRVNMLSDVQKRTGDRYFLAQWPLYVVENSNYLEWARGEDGGIYRDLEIVHYAILATQDFVEVLSTTEPTITWEPLSETSRNHFFLHD